MCCTGLRRHCNGPSSPSSPPPSGSAAPVEAASSAAAPSLPAPADTYAVVEIGGHQLIVEEGRWYTVNRLEVRWAYSRAWLLGRAGAGLGRLQGAERAPDELPAHALAQLHVGSSLAIDSQQLRMRV